MNLLQPLALKNVNDSKIKLSMIVEMSIVSITIIGSSSFLDAYALKKIIKVRVIC